MTLDEAVRLAISRNEPSHISEDLSAAAAGRFDRVRSSFFRTLTATGSYTRRPYQTVRRVAEDQTVVIQRFNALAGSATLQLGPFTPSAPPLYRQAAREAEAARLDASNARRLLAFQVADAFWAALSVQQVLRSAQRRLEVARKGFEDARARYQSQLVGSNYLTRAQLELATSEREAARAEGDAENAYLQLAFLLNSPIPGPLVEPTEVPQSSLTAEKAEVLVEEARKRRPDLAAARLHAAAAHGFAAEPLLRLVPSLGLFGQARVNNEPALTGRSLDGAVGLNLTWLIFDAGVRDADRTERQALADIADQNARTLERLMELQIRRALLSLENVCQQRRWAPTSLLKGWCSATWRSGRPPPWKNQTEKETVAKRKEALSAAASASNVEQWAVNKAVHYNEWANFGRKDFEPVVAVFKALLACFRCDTCQSWIHVVLRSIPETLRCGCNAINLNLKGKSKQG